MGMGSGRIMLCLGLLKPSKNIHGLLLCVAVRGTGLPRSVVRPVAMVGSPWLPPDGHHSWNLTPYIWQGVAFLILKGKESFSV